MENENPKKGALVIVVNSDEKKFMCECNILLDEGYYLFSAGLTPDVFDPIKEDNVIFDGSRKKPGKFWAYFVKNKYSTTNSDKP